MSQLLLALRQLHDSDSERTTSASPTSNAFDLEGGSPTPSITKTPPPHNPDPNDQRIFIRPNSMKAFEHFDAHWKIIDIITGYFSEAVKTYNGAPQSTKIYGLMNLRKHVSGIQKMKQPSYIQHYFPKVARRKNSRNGESSSHVTCDERIEQLEQINKEILEQNTKIMGLLQGIYSALPEFLQSVAPTTGSNQSSDVGLDENLSMNDDTQSPVNLNSSIF
nr:putative transposase En/Spm [Ipomoea batatas]